MFLLDQLFCDNFFCQKSLGNPNHLKIQKVQMIDILLKYILWYEFLNDLDAQSDFYKSFVTKKQVK